MSNFGGGKALGNFGRGKALGNSGGGKTLSKEEMLSVILDGVKFGVILEESFGNFGGGKALDILEEEKLWVILEEEKL